MSRPMCFAMRRKIPQPFGGFTPTLSWEFYEVLFFVYAAQILRWGVLLNAEEKMVGYSHMEIPKLYSSSSSKLSIFSNRWPWASFLRASRWRCLLSVQTGMGGGSGTSMACAM